MTIRESVAAVFVYEEQVFMIVRQPFLPAFPGYHAFPGGKVDRDESSIPFSDPRLQICEPRLMRALVREMREELDFDLEQACCEGLVSATHLLCSATTPPFEHYRFCNRFIRIDLTRRPVFKVDEQEAQTSTWLRPELFLQQWESAQALIVPPLRKILWALGQDIGLTHVENVDFTYDVTQYVPAMEVLPDLWVLPVKSYTLPPANHTNALVVGGYLVDPSPRDELELELLINTLDHYDGHGFSIEGIFLTHHHPDHHQFANVLARRRGWPITISVDSHTRILKSMGAGYFQDLEVHHAAEGDVLTHWRSQNVIVYAVPGHDEGQLALAPQDLSWFLVGDLIQGVGTVVISAPEGHMGRYFQTLQRVIDLAPAVIIPSHGIAMGGTYRLQATLAHRTEREREVLRLHEEGRTMTAMLDTIYQGLDEFLRPLATANIQAHLVKLREEGKIA